MTPPVLFDVNLAPFPRLPENGCPAPKFFAFSACALYFVLDVGGHVLALGDSAPRVVPPIAVFRSTPFVGVAAVRFISSCPSWFGASLACRCLQRFLSFFVYVMRCVSPLRLCSCVEVFLMPARRPPQAFRPRPGRPAPWFLLGARVIWGGPAVSRLGFIGVFRICGTRIVVERSA